MIPEIDIWRAANLLIRRHGVNAELEAAKRADLMLDRGDDKGRLLWRGLGGRSKLYRRRRLAGRTE